MPVFGDVRELDELLKAPLKSWTVVPSATLATTGHLESAQLVYQAGPVQNVLVKQKNGFEYSLGWDSAALLERPEGGHQYFLTKIFISEGRTCELFGVSPETKFYESEAKQKKKNQKKTVLQPVFPECYKVEAERHASREWHVIDLSANKVPVHKLMTFGVSSCSFSVLWPKDFRFLVVSHLSAKPSVPLVSIARNYAPRGVRTSELSRRSESKIATPTHQYNLLASVHPDIKEHNKFLEAQMDVTKAEHVDALLLSRGPLSFSKAKILGLYMPCLWHACIGVEYAESSGWVLRGIFGCNENVGKSTGKATDWNWATLGMDLSSLGMGASHVYVKGKAPRLATVGKNAIQGDYGFKELHKALSDAVKGPKNYVSFISRFNQSKDVSKIKNTRAIDAVWKKHRIGFMFPLDETIAALRAGATEKKAPEGSDETLETKTIIEAKVAKAVAPPQVEDEGN